jgi:hypothetical protein
MELCIKTLGHWGTVLAMWISNIYLWLLDADSVMFLDSSMKYITFVMGVSSAIIYITLTVLKKKKARKEIEMINSELENERIEAKIKNLQLNALLKSENDSDKLTKK